MTPMQHTPSRPVMPKRRLGPGAGRYPRPMDYQGTRRGRHGADPRQSPWPADQAPWAPAEEPDYVPPVPPVPVVPVGPGSGPHPGTAPQPVLGAASGPQRVPAHRPAAGHGPAHGGAADHWPAHRPAAGDEPHAGARLPAGVPAAPAPAGQAGWEQPEPSTVTFRPVRSPGAPQAGGYYDGIGQDRGSGPVPPASVPQDPARGDQAPGDQAPGDQAPGDQAAGRRGTRSGRSGRSKRHPSRVVAWLGLIVVLAAAGFGGYKYLYQPRVNAPVSARLKLPTERPQLAELRSGPGQVAAHREPEPGSGLADPDASCTRLSSC